MTREGSWELPTRSWRIAAVVTAAAMLAWLGWHAAGAVLTVDRLRDSHRAATAVHDSILRLETEIQRTAQLFIATRQTRWLSLHSRTEGELRSVLTGLLADAKEGKKPGEESIREALAALDALSRIENEAFALLDAGRDEAALSRITGPEYMAGLDWLGESVRHFDARYHDWILSASLGLTRREAISLLGAAILFSLAIVAWLSLVRRLQREKTALAEEIAARARAEDELLRTQKLELLGQLASGVAHDLDNVLSATAGYTLLARKARDEEHRRRALDGLDRAVGLGRGLTTNLLSFMRREHSGHQPTELRATLREAREWLMPLLPEHIELVTEQAGGDPLWVNADPVQLHQVFANLALNAFDAMPGGGMLRIVLSGMPDKHTGARQPRGGGIARLEFADTGHGMDPETLARAREPFFSRKPRGKGSGLGLGSVDRILETHGGRLELESVLGEGTLATAYLPLIAAPDRITRESCAAPKALLASRDGYAQKLLLDSLEDAGLAATVTTVESLAGVPPGGPSADTIRVIDWPGQFDELPAELHACLAAAAGTPVVLLLEPGQPMELGQSAATAIGDHAFVVSRATPLGEVGEFVRRLVARAGRQP